MSNAVGSMEIYGPDGEGRASKDEMRWIDKLTVDKGSYGPFENPESVGYILDSSMPTAGTIISGMYLSAALVELANREVGCETGDDDGIEDCEKLLWGLFNPNSIYIVISFTASLLAAVGMPVFGSIIDHSIYRKEVGLYSILVMLAIMILQTMIDGVTFTAVAILHIFMLYGSLVHAVVYSAYLPEIAPTQSDLVRHRTYGSTLMFGFELLFLIIMFIILVVAIKDNKILAARYACVIGALYLSVVTYLAYGKFFRSRPASQQVPPGRSIVTAGCYKLVSTLSSISVTHPYLMRYLVAIALVDGTMSVFATISISYLDVQLGMKPSQSSGVIGIILVVSFLASPLVVIISRKIAEKYGDAYAGKPLLVTACIYNGVVTFFASLMMRDESDHGIAYVFAVIWGFGFAMYYAIEKATYYFIVPVAQTAEFSGLAMFAGKILSWLPLFSFFIFYEQYKTMTYGLAFMSFFLLVGGVIIWSIDIEKAREHALQELGTEVATGVAKEKEKDIVSRFHESG
jgi:MFS transporter, UMF1 family